VKAKAWLSKSIKTNIWKNSVKCKVSSKNSFENDSRNELKGASSSRSRRYPLFPGLQSHSLIQVIIQCNQDWISLHNFAIWMSSNFGVPDGLSHTQSFGITWTWTPAVTSPSTRTGVGLQRLDSMG